MAQPVKGKTAIVTGAGSGINLSFATMLLAKGCNVVIADLALRPEAREVVDANSLPSESRGRAVFQKTDVRDWSQLERMFQTAEREFGPVDIVCPGAGVYEPVSTLRGGVCLPTWGRTKQERGDGVSRGRWRMKRNMTKKTKLTEPFAAI